VAETPQAAVRAAFDAFGAALDKGEIEEALSWCTEDVVFIGSGAGEEAVGRDAIPAMFAELAPHLEGLQFSLAWNSIDIDVLGDVAVVTAWGEAKLVSPDRNDTLRYRLTGVLVRTADRWLWRIHHGSEPGAW
jgi:uncharacterized protein (TIGR02246 family)